MENQILWRKLTAYNGPDLCVWNEDMRILYCPFKRGRSPKTWIEDLHEDLKSLNVTGWKSETSNRGACRLQ